MTNDELKTKLIDVYVLLGEGAVDAKTAGAYDKLYQIGLIMNEMYKTLTIQ